MTILLNNVSANTTSDEFEGDGSSAIVNIRADDFDGGTIEIQTASTQDPLDRFVALASGVFTANASIKIDYLPVGVKLRADLTGAGGSASNIFCDILQ